MSENDTKTIAELEESVLKDSLQTIEILDPEDTNAKEAVKTYNTVTDERIKREKIISDERIKKLELKLEKQKLELEKIKIENDNNIKLQTLELEREKLDQDKVNQIKNRKIEILKVVAVPVGIFVADCVFKSVWMVLNNRFETSDTHTYTSSKRLRDSILSFKNR